MFNTCFRSYCSHLLAVAAAIPIAALQPVYADECFADWGRAGEIVRREKLLTVEQLAATAGQDLAGDILKTTLCIERGAYIYRLVIRDRSGRLKSLNVQAVSPPKATTPR